MLTKAKLEANRRNAAHSTGPKTEAGRERSSRNALRHGLSAQKYLLPDEDAEAFAQFLEGLIADLQPVGTDETELVEQIAHNRWRQRRVYRAEVGMFESESPDTPYYTFPDSIKTLGSHEANIRKTLAYLEKRLKELQNERRRREASAAPADDRARPIVVNRGDDQPTANDHALSAADRLVAFDGGGEREPNQKTNLSSTGDGEAVASATQDSDAAAALDPQGKKRKTNPRPPGTRRRRTATDDTRPQSMPAPAPALSAGDPKPAASVPAVAEEVSVLTTPKGPGVESAPAVTAGPLSDQAATAAALDDASTATCSTTAAARARQPAPPSLDQPRPDASGIHPVTHVVPPWLRIGS